MPELSVICNPSRIHQPALVAVVKTAPVPVVRMRGILLASDGLTRPAGNEPAAVEVIVIGVETEQLLLVRVSPVVSNVSPANRLMTSPHADAVIACAGVAKAQLGVDAEDALN